MSVTSYDVKTVDNAAGCPGCAERDTELQHLRLELDAFQQQQVRGRFDWWCILIMGFFAFLMIPFVIFLVSALIRGPRWESDWATLIVNAVLRCVLISQFCLIALITALHWRPKWQRMGMAIGALFLLCPVSAVVYVAGSEYDFWDETAFEIPVLPMAVAVSIVPVFILRAFHRCTITPRPESVRARPLTLSSYFVLVSLFGLASAILKLGEWNEAYFTTSAEAVGGFLIHFGVPALSIGGLFSVLIPTILDREGQRLSTWVRRLIAIGLAAAAGPMLLGVAILALDGETLDWTIVAYLLSHCLATAAGAFLLAATAIVWLRLLDYQLVSVPRSSAVV